MSRRIMYEIFTTVSYAQCTHLSRNAVRLQGFPSREGKSSLFVGLRVRVVHTPVLPPPKRLLELRGQVSAETVLERPHALAMRDTYPVTIMQYRAQIGLHARQRRQVAVDKRDSSFLGGDSQADLHAELTIEP